ncbi:MAG TPA: NAD(P)H-dependent oxidoreductase subunit E, partial [Ginsengibacter sp.]
MSFSQLNLINSFVKFFEERELDSTLLFFLKEHLYSSFKISSQICLPVEATLEPKINLHSNSFSKFQKPTMNNGIKKNFKEPVQTQMLNKLWELQKINGYIHDDDIKQLANLFNLSEIEVEGVVSFYHF